MGWRFAVNLTFGVVIVAGSAAIAQSRPEPDSRTAVLASAQVWQPGDVGSRNLHRGPTGPDAFEFRETVSCEYMDKKLSGNSPKFACRTGSGEELKVKHGGTNAEVYGEVLASRLLWGLGFGADRMYPVTVICRGCPQELGGIARPDGTSRFDPAVIERKFAMDEYESERPGWSFEEVDRLVAGGAGPPRDHFDALKLFAVLVQHTDSKPQQQRIVCTKTEGDRCARPFLLISDVGLTFGRANRANANHLAVDLVAWRAQPVWKEGPGCVGNLPRSITGSLGDPVISEAGRRFLADLLSQLSDDQLRGLFTAARVTLRLRDPNDVRSGFPTVDEWVEAFKDKRQQIVDRRCA